MNVPIKIIKEEKYKHITSTEQSRLVCRRVHLFILRFADEALINLVYRFPSLTSGLFYHSVVFGRRFSVHPKFGFLQIKINQKTKFWT